MLKSEMIAKNPLRAFDQHREGGLKPGQAGLIAARAGTGKTALLTHIALDNLFRGSTILHVSIGETVSHVQAWYEEIFRDLALGYDLEQSRRVWDEIIPNRLILTFRAETFSVKILEERLNDLMAQDIFKPRVIVLDGLDLLKDNSEALTELKSYVRELGLKAWVAARSHREQGDIAGMLDPIAEHFEVILGIEPKGDALELTAFKNPNEDVKKLSVSLDPKTLLLVSKDGQ